MAPHLLFNKSDGGSMFLSSTVHYFFLKNSSSTFNTKFPYSLHFMSEFLKFLITFTPQFSVIPLPNVTRRFSSSTV